MSVNSEQPLVLNFHCHLTTVHCPLTFSVQRDRGVR
jgi:hypothetical protein